MIRLSLVTVVVAVALVGSACETPPSSPPPTDHPRAPTVSDESLAAALPMDANGKPILLTVDGSPLTIGPKRVDAIGAAAICSDLKNDCVQVTKDLDSCVDKVPRCTTETPWLEEAPCCATACVLAYQEERRLGASPLEANRAVFSSTHECFPGLQAQVRAAGGSPRRLPRRAP